MGRSSAFAFLCECLSSVATGHHGIGASVSAFRWADLIALTHEFRVSSTVAVVFETLPASASVPSEARAFFAGVATHARRHSEQVRKEAIDVAKILNSIGINPVFLKGGAHLFTNLYPDIAMRQMADLDILVPATRIDDCLAALRDNDIAQLSDYLHPRSHQSRPLGREDLPVHIELHHFALAYPRCDFLTPEEIQSSAIHLISDGVRVAVPSSTCSVVHNIAHAQFNDHDYLYGRIDLRGLVDLALLSKTYSREIDWETVFQRFVDSKRRHALEYHIEWGRRLGANVPTLGTGKLSRLLYRRACFQALHPRSLSLSVRLLRPFVLLRRELSDPLLRRRLAANLLKLDWWKRHLRMLRSD